MSIDCVQFAGRAVSSDGGTILDRKSTLTFRLPRTVSELWAFSGYKPGQRRRKGERANWSADAKQRAYRIAEKCCQSTGGQRGPVMTRRSPYRDIYEKRRAVTADRVHAEACARCGPSGHPAATGTPWSAGHQHTDALHIVAKELLRDLWRAARDIHST